MGLAGRIALVLLGLCSATLWAEQENEVLVMDEPTAPASAALPEPATSEETAPVSYESPMKFGLDFEYLNRKYEKYEFADGITTTDQPTSLRINFEWLFYQRYGKTGVGFSTGFSVLPNIFIGPDPADPTSDGIFGTLYTIPLGVYFTYRGDFVKDQILVPFGKFGLNYSLVKQNSKTGGSRDFATYMGLEFGGGVELCLDPLDRSAERGLEQNFGINSTYLVFEYILAQNLSNGKQPDLSGVEYRAGLRFEL